MQSPYSYSNYVAVFNITKIFCIYSRGNALLLGENLLFPSLVQRSESGERSSRTFIREYGYMEEISLWYAYLSLLKHIHTCIHAYYGNVNKINSEI
jgi:hypothetical protein